MSSSYPYSDEDSTDSDSGIRFKTTNTRNHVDKKPYDDRIRTRKEYQHRRSRSRSRDRYNSNRRNRHRSRTPEKSNKHEKHRRRHSDKTEKYEKDEGYGPKLPPKKEEGPSTSQNDDVYGPTLPPPPAPPPPVPAISTNSTKSRTKVIGPTLPPHLKQSLSEDIPSKDSDDDDFVGPLPAGHSSANPNFTRLEERALEIKLNGLNKPESDSKVREEWMLELPAVHTANLGLGPRQFRAKGVPDMSDRSSWTDTPQDKQNKASNKHKSSSSSSKSDLKRDAELEHLKQRDLEQAKIVDKHKKKKKRDKSLLDIHQEKLNKKKKEESSKEQVRRPFSRDIDLKANRFDEAQKKSILKKAQLLDNRFSSGESKFL